MQFRILVVGGNIRVFLVEKRGGVEPVGAAMPVGLAVNGICAGNGAHVDMCAAGRSLLRIVHGGVYAHLLKGLGRGRWQSLANREIDRGPALDRCSCRAVGIGDTGVVYDPSGSHLAGALTVE